MCYVADAQFVADNPNVASVGPAPAGSRLAGYTQRTKTFLATEQGRFFPRDVSEAAWFTRCLGGDQFQSFGIAFVEW